MADIQIVFVLATLMSISNSEYIPPGPLYPCPKETESHLLYPCVCEKGTDTGLFIRCENTGLAVMSVGLGNIAGLGFPIERLLLKEAKIAHLFGPLLHRSTVRVLHIVDTPIKSIDAYAFAGVNKTLQELYMVNTKIVEFPKDAFKILGNLSILSIDGHEMKTLGKDIFAGSEAAGRLERLHLSNGKIADVAAEAFQYLKKLKTLDLHGNRLATLKRNQFKGLRDTEVLDLSYNNITKLDGSHIGDLTKLGWCNASHNQIGEIPRGMFARNTVIKVVHLDNNKIKKLDTNSFRGMRFLRRLFLQDNQISDVGRGTFSAVTRIGTVDLARNKITKVDFQMFQQVRYAEVINLAENRITIIEKQAFTDLYLAVVNISHNALETIETGAFVNCNNMTVLDLSHNALRTVARNAFDENSYAGELQVSYNLFTDLGQVPIQNMTGLRLLNASHNNIQVIPKTAIPKLYELHTVDVSYNNLSEIHNAVFQNLFSLRYLYLSHNSMEQLKPSTFGTVPTVLELDLSHNRLRDSSRGALAKLASCRLLDLSHNRLERIPQIPISLGTGAAEATFGTVPTVLELDLSHNRLRDSSRGALAKLASCRLLDLSHNRLERIPQIPISLGELNFAHNNLTEIKANTWPAMNALLRLNLSHNQIGDNLAGDAFSGLLTLQALDLSYNGLTRPPWEALNTLSSLQYLYLQHNNLTSLSKSAFGNLPTTFQVDLSHNQLADIAPRSFAGLQQLLDLSLSGNRLRHVPNEAFKGLVALRSVDLSHNQLADIAPRSFAGLQQLLDLSLSGNRLRHVPNEAFKGLVALRKLDLSYNFLQKIDNKTNGLLDDCLSLEKVNLSHNQFGFLTRKMFPSSPWIPYRLQEIDLSYNEIPVVTYDITFGAKMVKRLNFAGNYINDIRNNVLGNLTSLEVLDLSHNMLKDLISRTSETKFNLPANLTQLILYNNSLESLPAARLAAAARLALLDARRNALTSLAPELVAAVRTRGLRVLFDDNKLKCDCLVRPLKHYLNHLLPSVLATDTVYSNITCAEPPSLEGELLVTLDEERLLCAGNTELQDKLESYGNSDPFMFVTEPDLAFRDIQYSQTSIYIHWFVATAADLADYFIYIRDINGTLVHSSDVSYHLRSLTVAIDSDFKEGLQKGGSFEICIQGKTSNNFARKWFESQCQFVPNNFNSWPKKLVIDKRRLSKKRVSYRVSNSVLGLVSDSILITLCIFIGVCFRRLADLEV